MIDEDADNTSDISEQAQTFLDACTQISIEERDRLARIMRRITRLPREHRSKVTFEQVQAMLNIDPDTPLH